MQANYVAADIAISLHGSCCLCLVCTLSLFLSFSPFAYTLLFSSPQSMCLRCSFPFSISQYLYMCLANFEGTEEPKKRKFNFTSLNKVRYGSASVFTNKQHYSVKQFAAVGPHTHTQCVSVVLLVQYYTCTSYIFLTDYYYFCCVFFSSSSFLTLFLLLLPKVATVFTGCNLRQRFRVTFRSNCERQKRRKTIPEGIEKI